VYGNKIKMKEVKVYTDLDEFLKVHSPTTKWDNGYDQYQVSEDFTRQQFRLRLEKYGNLIYLPTISDRKIVSSCCTFSKECYHNIHCGWYDECVKAYNTHIREEKLKKILK